jgi:hypothetical protein
VKSFSAAGRTIVSLSYSLGLRPHFEGKVPLGIVSASLQHPRRPFGRLRAPATAEGAKGQERDQGCRLVCEACSLEKKKTRKWIANKRPYQPLPEYLRLDDSFGWRRPLDLRTRGRRRRAFSGRTQATRLESLGKNRLNLQGRMRPKIDDDQPVLGSVGHESLEVLRVFV